MTWDDLEDEGFTVTGRASGYTTPKIGGNASSYGFDMTGGMGSRFGGFDPFALGQGISGITMGRGSPGQTFMAEESEPGAFSQLGSAIAGGAGKVGGAIKSGVGAVGDFLGWDDMKPMERAWLLSQAVGTGLDVYSQHKAGQQEDEERKRRQRSAEALRPFIQSMMAGTR